MDPKENESLGFINVDNYKKLTELEQEFATEIEAFQDLVDNEKEFTVENLTEAIEARGIVPIEENVQNYYDLVKSVIAEDSFEIEQSTVEENDYLDIISIAEKYLVPAGTKMVAEIEPDEFKVAQAQLESDLSEGEITEIIYEQQLRDLKKKAERKEVFLYDLDKGFYPEIVKYYRERSRAYAQQQIIDDASQANKFQTIYEKDLGERNAYSFMMLETYLRNPEGYKRGVEKFFEENPDARFQIDYQVLIGRTEEQEISDKKLSEEYNKYIQEDIQAGKIVAPAPPLSTVLITTTEMTARAYTFLKDYQNATVLYKKEVERRKKENPNLRTSRIEQSLRVELEQLSDEEKQNSLLYQSYLFGDFNIEQIMDNEKSYTEVMRTVPLEFRKQAHETVTDELARRKKNLSASQYQAENLQNIIYFIGKYGDKEEIESDELGRPLFFGLRERMNNEDYVNFFFENISQLDTTGPEFDKDKADYLDAMENLGIKDYDDLVYQIHKANLLQNGIMESESVYLLTAMNPEMYESIPAISTSLEEATTRIGLKYHKFEAGENLNVDLEQEKKGSYAATSKSADQITELYGSTFGHLLETNNKRNIFNEIPAENLNYTLNLVYDLERVAKKEHGTQKTFLGLPGGPTDFQDTRKSLESYIRKVADQGNWRGTWNFAKHAIGGFFGNKFSVQKDADYIAGEIYSGEVRLLIEDTKKKIEQAKKDGNEEALRSLNSELYRLQKELEGVNLAQEVISDKRYDYKDRIFDMFDIGGLGSALTSVGHDYFDTGALFKLANKEFRKIENEVLYDIQTYQKFQRVGKRYVGATFDDEAYANIDTNKDYDLNSPGLN